MIKNALECEDQRTIIPGAARYWSTSQLLVHLLVNSEAKMAGRHRARAMWNWTWILDGCPISLSFMSKMGVCLGSQLMNETSWSLPWSSSLELRKWSLDSRKSILQPFHHRHWLGLWSIVPHSTLPLFFVIRRRNAWKYRSEAADRETN